MAKWLQDRGWIVASRRHIGGAGDLLAVHPEPLVLGGTLRSHGYQPQIPVTSVWLIEVKCCKNLWQQFRRADREEMKTTKLPEGGERWVVNKKGRELTWVPESAWPA